LSLPPFHSAVGFIVIGAVSSVVRLQSVLNNAPHILSWERLFYTLDFEISSKIFLRGMDYSEIP